MRQWFLVEKQEAETPLQCLERFHTTHPELYNEKMTYAGRLAPMASGQLLILAGNERFRKDEYLALDKEYECDIVLGIATDSGDILGLPDVSDPPARNAEEIRAAIEQLTGTLKLPIPAYSSPSINGVPLFRMARHDTITETTPVRPMHVYKVTIKNSEVRTLGTIANECVERIKRFEPPHSARFEEHDFRKEEIIQAW